MGWAELESGVEDLIFGVGSGFDTFVLLDLYSYTTSTTWYNAVGRFTLDLDPYYMTYVVAVSGAFESGIDSDDFRDGVYTTVSGFIEVDNQVPVRIEPSGECYGYFWIQNCSGVL